MEVALLRSTGRTAEARNRLAERLREDPTSAMLRNEGILLGASGTSAAAGESLWRHLAADPERVIEVAADYMEIGMYADALALLSRHYPAVDAQETEPGAVLPQDYPLVAYYRGYCREKLGQSGRPDFDMAARQSTRYVFPNRAGSLPVLRRAIASNPSDATAHALLGSLWMSGGMVDRALAEWELARRLNPHMPALHRNIARTLLDVKHDEAGALEVYREGLGQDPENMELYTGMNVVLSLLRHPASERADTLLRYPDRDGLTTPMRFDLALSLAEAGRIAEAEQTFQGRFFAREEGGVNVRRVWVEVELRKALALARAGRKQEALGVAGALGKEAPGLAFTREGMEAFQRGARYEYLLGKVEAASGDAASARGHWESAAAGSGPYGLLASRELGRADWSSRAEQQVAGSGDGAARNGDVLARGLLLRALGREGEALAAFREVLLKPDRDLSYYVARAAMLEPESK